MPELSGGSELWLGLSVLAAPIISEAGTRDGLCVYAALGHDSRRKNEARLNDISQNITWLSCSEPVLVVAGENVATL